MLWKNGTAGFHRTDVSVPTEVLDGLEGERVRKRKEKEAGCGKSFKCTAHSFFPVFRGVAQLRESKVQRATVGSD